MCQKDWESMKRRGMLRTGVTAAVAFALPMLVFWFTDALSYCSIFASLALAIFAAQCCRLMEKRWREDFERENARCKEIADRYEREKNVSSAKSDDLSQLRHNIRTSMNTIMRMTAIADAHMGDRECVKDCLEKIRIFSGQLLELQNEVSETSNKEAGEAERKEENAAGEIKKEEKLLKKWFDGERVLLVENNELSAEITMEILDMAGLQVDCAENGKKALDMMAASESGYYDVIFMDIQMPVMDGYEATHAIRNLPGEYFKKIPIIAMTADAFAEDVRKAQQAGMNQHITKPIDFAQLSKVLKKWL